MEDLLGIGLTGKTLTDLERKIITENTPYAVVLFGRNIADVEQIVGLIREVKSLAPSKPPLFMIDEEGGRVDRIRHLVPGLPSAEAFAEGEQPLELSNWLGRVIGMALRYFDIEIDLAPVVDIRGEQSPKGLERRTFGADPETVIELAGAFMRGLHSMGVASCLKHFPGIGLGSADPHYGATVMDLSLDELVARDMVPFSRLGNESGAVMIGHGTYPQIDDPDLPATLSHRITTDVLRQNAGFTGVAITDDMEMHSVADLGSYEYISDRALMAGNDVILYCSHIERVPSIQRYLREKAEKDETFGARYREAGRRAEAYRAHCERLRREGEQPAAKFSDIIDETVRFLEVFEKTRPPRDKYIPESERRKNSRTPGKGTTGREEWT